jgi:hypothetical protein
VIGYPMPFAMYRELSDEDVMAMVAFLRTLPAVENEAPESVCRIPLPPAYGPALTTVSDPARWGSVEYGAYLAERTARPPSRHRGLRVPKALGGVGRA